MLALLPVTAFAMPERNGKQSCEDIYQAVPADYTDDISITVVNTFSCSYADQILGLDLSSDSSVLMFVSNVDDKLYLCNPDDGTYIGDLVLEYAPDPDQFGICVDDAGNCYFNDFEMNHMYWWDTSAWHLMTNPIGDDGIGMDFDGTKIWETFNWTPKQVVRFNTDGSGLEYYDIPELSTAQPSGLATFPYESNTGVVVTSYNSHNLYFYEFDGSILSSIGFVPCPLPCMDSLGLTYSSTRGTFFWSYQDSSGNFWASELEIDFSGSSFEQSTWGAIKIIDHL